MAHPQNKHDRFLISMKKGLKRAVAQNCHSRFESIQEGNNPEHGAKLREIFLDNTRSYRDTTTNRANTRYHNARAEERARKAQLSLRDLERAYKPVKAEPAVAYDMDYLFA